MGSTTRQNFLNFEHGGFDPGRTIRATLLLVCVRNVCVLCGVCVCVCVVVCGCEFVWLCVWVRVSGVCVCVCVCLLYDVCL